MIAGLNVRALQVKSKLTAINLNKTKEQLKTLQAELRRAQSSSSQQERTFKTVLKNIAQLRKSALEQQIAMPQALVKKCSQQIIAHKKKLKDESEKVEAAMRGVKECYDKYATLCETEKQLNVFSNEIVAIKERNQNAHASEELHEIFLAAVVNRAGCSTDALPSASAANSSSRGASAQIISKQQVAAEKAAYHLTNVVAQECTESAKVQFTLETGSSERIAVALSGDSSGNVSLGLGLLGERPGAGFYRARKQLLEELKRAGYKVRQMRPL